MGIVNYKNGLASFGIPLFGSIPTTSGKIFFVDYTLGSDNNLGTSTSKPFKTISKAYSMATTNKDDVICLMGNATHVLTEMLTVSKNRVHFIGIDGTHGRMYGQNAKVSMGVTTSTADIHAVKNIGVRNSFTNIKFISNNTLTEHTSCVGEGGEYAAYYNCEFYASVKLDSNTYAEVLLNGDSAQFYGCTFGSLADLVDGNKVRPAIITTLAGVASSQSSGYCRDVLFDKCKFWKKAGGTTTAMVQITADTVERVMEFHDCQFVANVLGAVPAVAIASAVSLTVGQVILTGDTCAFECTKIATATGILNGTPARVATATIGIQAT